MGYFRASLLGFLLLSLQLTACDEFLEKLQSLKYRPLFDRDGNRILGKLVQKNGSLQLWADWNEPILIRNPEEELEIGKDYIRFKYLATE